MGYDSEALAYHTRQIRLAKRRLDRARQRAAEAEQDYRQTIRDAFAADITAEPISRAAGVGIHRVRQIKAGRRT